MASDTGTPQHESLLRVPEFDAEEFSRVLSTIAIVSKTPEAFYELLDACEELSHAANHSYSVELSSLAGPRPYSISPRLVSLETLTYFGICVKTTPLRNIAVYTLSEPLGIDFISHLAAMIASAREVALRRGADTKAFIQYLMQRRGNTQPPMEEKYLRYVRDDLRAVLLACRAELTFYLIDHRDPDNWN